MENNFASNLKFLRLQNSLTQEELGKRLGKDYSTIGKWENGTRSPIMEDVIKIAEYFNVNLSELIASNYVMNTSYKSTEEDLKKVLEEKGLLDKNGNLDKDKIDKVNKIYEVITNKEEN